MFEFYCILCPFYNIICPALLRVPPPFPEEGRIETPDGLDPRGGWLVARMLGAGMPSMPGFCAY